MSAPGRSRFPLTHQIVASLAIGVVLGLFAPDIAVALKPLSTVFLRMIKMLLGPLLLTTLIAGIAGTSAKMVGRLAVKSIIWFEVATTVALVIGLGAANLLRPGDGVELKAEGHDAAPVAAAPAAAPTVATPATAAAPSTATAATAPATATPAAAPQVKTRKLVDILVEMVPVSIMDAWARNDVLQIVVFAIFLGLAISAAGTKARMLHELAEAGTEAMFKLVGFVMRFAPLGVGAAIAVTVGSNGAGVLVPLLKCVLALYAALVVFFVLLFAAMVALTRVHLPTFLRAIREPAIIAFTTSTSDAALPRAIQALDQLGVPRRIVSFVVPTGYAFNLDGSTLYLALAVMFVAQAAGHAMTLGEQIAAMVFLMAATKGVAGVPRAAIVVLGGALAAFHLPAEGVALLLGIDALMDMGRTCVNVVGNCVAAVVVAAWEDALPPSAAIFGPRAAPVASPIAPTDPPDQDRAT